MDLSLLFLGFRHGPSVCCCLAPLVDLLLIYIELMSSFGVVVVSGILENFRLELITIRRVFAVILRHYMSE